MAIKKPRKQTKKPAPAAASAHAGGSSLAMPEMLPHGPGAGASHIQPPTPLPPGVYFGPTKEECLRFLNRSIAGDSALPGARGYIFHANTAGSKSADRRVNTGGSWRSETSKKTLDDGAGCKSRFGFYTGPTKKDRSPWLMQEFTSAKDDGAGKRAAPALYRVYVTPHATDDELRGIYGEDGVKIGPDGEKKPDRAVVPEEYFDAIGKLLPQGSVRCGVGQEHVALP
ncbi:hypothetical protein ACQ4PT_005762 [Festuca glaucescens]